MKTFSKYLFISLTAITAGLFVAVLTMAFTGPGSNQPPNGSPSFWALNGTNMYYSGGNVGIGTTGPGQQLEITQNFKLPSTTGTTPYGIIYKGTSPFISDFNYGNNGTVTTVGYNTFVGIGAGNLTMGSTATVGNQSSYNTALGNGALHSNTTGNYNIANGGYALYSNTTGYNNIANGVYALYSNTTGNYNIANGVSALASNTTGNYNIANGVYALYSNTTGYYNTANGFQSLFSNTTGYANTANGYYSLHFNTTGFHNTANGVTAGYSIVTGNSNTFLGYGAGYNALQLTSASNSMALGNGAYTTASNQVVIGNSAITQTLLNGNVGIGTTGPGYTLTVSGTAWVTSGAWSGSDIRWKKDVVPLSDVLGKVNQLQGVKFDWRKDEFPKMNFPSGSQIGFIAQDVEPIFPELVTTDNNGYKGISYEKFVPVLTEAIKELNAKVDSQQKEIESLKAAQK